MSMNDDQARPITIFEMLRQAPDLFCASEQFLAIESNFEEALK